MWLWSKPHGRHPPTDSSIPQLLSQPMRAQCGGWTLGHVITSSQSKRRAGGYSCRTPLLRQTLLWRTEAAFIRKED